MTNAINGLVNALTTSMSTYATAIGSGIVDGFKYIFLELDSNGTVVGLNLLGYTAIILLGLGIILLIVVVLCYYMSSAYKMSLVPDNILSELSVEYDELMHQEQLDTWRELVFNMRGKDSGKHDISEHVLANALQKSLDDYDFNPYS